MPLTNAQKQKAHRQRQREKIARMEGVLRDIARQPFGPDIMRDLARDALR